MKEKYRYKIHEVCPNLIVDTVSNMVINSKVNNELDLLNQQDKRIKELEEENKLLKEDLVYEKNFWRENNKTNFVLHKKLKKENSQLKQQLEATTEQLTNLTDNFEDDEHFSAYENTKRFIEDTMALFEYLVSFSDKLGIAHNFLALEQYIYGLPKKIVEEIKEHCAFCERCNEWIISEKKIDIILNKILKKYGEENKDDDI